MKLATSSSRAKRPTAGPSYQAGEGANSDAITAVGMLTHLLLLKDHDAPIVKSSASYLAGRRDVW